MQNICRITFSLLLLFSLQACSQIGLNLNSKQNLSAESSLSDLLSSADQKLRDKDFEGAIKVLDLAIQKDANSRDAYFKRGLANSNLAQSTLPPNNLAKLAESITDFDKTLELDPSYIEGYIQRAIVKAESGNRESALEDLNKAIEMNPSNSEIYENRGFLKISIGDKEGGISDFNKIIELDPQSENAYSNRCKAKLMTLDFQGAINDCSKGIEINPKLKDAYMNRASARIALRKNKEARQRIAIIAALIDTNGQVLADIVKLANPNFRAKGA